MNPPHHSRGRAGRGGGPPLLPPPPPPPRPQRPKTAAPPRRARFHPPPRCPPWRTHRSGAQAGPSPSRPRPARPVPATRGSTEPRPARRVPPTTETRRELDNGSSGVGQTSPGRGHRVVGRRGGLRLGRHAADEQRRGPGGWQPRRGWWRRSSERPTPQETTRVAGASGGQREGGRSVRRGRGEGAAAPRADGGAKPRLAQAHRRCFSFRRK